MLETARQRRGWSRLLGRRTRCRVTLRLGNSTTSCDAPSLCPCAAFAGAFFQTIGASNVGIGNAGPLLAAEFNNTVVRWSSHAWSQNASRGCSGERWAHFNPSLLPPPAGRAPVVIPRPLRHPLQKILWGIGLLAAANASTVTSTYAGQVVMDGFMGWKVSEGALACAGLP